MSHSLRLKALATIILGKSLDGVGECMSEVQLATLILLELVTRHHPCLDTSRCCNELIQSLSMLFKKVSPDSLPLLSIHHHLNVILT